MIKIFYHKKDLDGWASGAICKRHFTNESEMLEMYPINYGDKFPWEWVTSEDVIFMCDFSLPMEEMDRLNNLVKQNFFWIDHHIGAIKDYEKKNNYLPILGKRDTSLSGCELTWQYFYPNRNIPFFIKLLGLYDRWDHSGYYATWTSIENFQYGFKSEVCDPSQDMTAWNSWFGKTGNLLGSSTLIDNCAFLGKKIKAYVESRYDDILSEKSHVQNWNGYKCLIVNSDTYIANYMTRSLCFKGCDVAIVYTRNKNDSWEVSLRTNKDDIDLSALAKQYGGGGHKAASGFGWKDKDLPWMER